jgi:hypothetical protein
MPSSARSSRLARLLFFLAALSGLIATPSVRRRALSIGANRPMWTLVAAVSGLWAALNFKNVPFVWHYRVLRAMFYQLYLQPRAQQPKHLFAPVINKSYNTPYDTDWNLHKSNSTYFADLDVARSHLMSCIIRTGLARLNRGDEEGLSETIMTTPG